MRNWILISIVIMALAVGTLAARTSSAKELADKGLAVFHDVLGGDETKLAEAVQYMEDARKADEKNIDNLYNLARAYFYEGITFNKVEPIIKAEQITARIMELDPKKTEALAFHGSLLTIMSGGRDIPKFMQGAQEMKKAIELAPKNINNRIVLAFTARNFPPQALAAMGNYDPLPDLEFVSNAFEGDSFFYAPHADTVMKAFVGETYKSKGDSEKAKAKFEAALAVPKPKDPGERAGRELIDAAIKARMNGGEKTLFSGVFSGCHSCHLNAPDKLAATR